MGSIGANVSQNVPFNVESTVKIARMCQRAHVPRRCRVKRSGAGSSDIGVWSVGQPETSEEPTLTARARPASRVRRAHASRHARGAACQRRERAARQRAVQAERQRADGLHRGSVRLAHRGRPVRCAAHHRRQPHVPRGRLQHVWRLVAGQVSTDRAARPDPLVHGGRARARPCSSPRPTRALPCRRWT